MEIIYTLKEYVVEDDLLNDNAVFYAFTEENETDDLGEIAYIFLINAINRLKSKNEAYAGTWDTETYPIIVSNCFEGVLAQLEILEKDNENLEVRIKNKTFQTSTTV